MHFHQLHPRYTTLYYLHYSFRYFSLSCSVTRIESKKGCYTLAGSGTFLPKRLKTIIIFIWKFINMSSHTFVIVLFYHFWISVCATTIPFSKRLWRPSCSVYSIFQNAVLLYIYFTQAQSNTSVFWPILCDT